MALSLLELHVCWVLDLRGQLNKMIRLVVSTSVGRWRRRRRAPKGDMDGSIWAANLKGSLVDDAPAQSEDFAKEEVQVKTKNKQKADCTVITSAGLTECVCGQMCLATGVAR